MASKVLFFNKQGDVRVSFSNRSLIGLNRGHYKLVREELTPDLKTRINVRLKELAQTDPEILSSLIRSRDIKKIYDLFGIEDLQNGWSVREWCEREKERSEQSRKKTNLLVMEFQQEKAKAKEKEYHEWKLYGLKLETEPFSGVIRSQRLKKQAAEKLKRSFSLTDLGKPEKIQEYPFFLERWNLGPPVKVKTPKFIKNVYKVPKILRLEKKKRRAY